MAPMQRKLRKALGSLKDQTSISLAKVASSGAPDLDVALVKATSHDEVPIEEKHVQEILHLTSYSRAYVNACVSGLARRLSKTHDWIVAIKALMLAHRLLRDGDPAFEQEMMFSGRRGMRLLNVSDFRDESHSNAWDHSAFVRTYGMYLDERLDCSIGSLAKVRPERRSAYNESRYDHGDSGYYQDSYGSRNEYEDQSRREEETQRGPKNVAVKDMPADELLEKFSALQRLVERVLACRPTGAAKTNRLVHIALYPVVRESFQLYNDIRDGLAVLLEAFFDMEERDCVKAFDIYSREAKQVEELISFYSFCKALGVCRATEYPTVDRISEEQLEMMEEFLRNRSSDSARPSRRPKSPEARSRSPARDRAEEESYEINGMKALPAPPVKPEAAAAAAGGAPPPKPAFKAADLQQDLLDLKEPAMSSEQHSDRLALALFSGTESSSKTMTVNTTWETFSSSAGGEQAAMAMQSSGNGAAAAGATTKTGWELALVESESDLSRNPNGKEELAGGFDRLLLDSLYDQGADRQKFASATAPSGSASSVALPGRPQSSFLALPAPPPSAGQPFMHEGDPFLASVAVPPPAYVQMADLKQKQQFLVQEQQLWLQYQQQGHAGLMKFPNNPFAAAASFQPAAYPVPYYGGNSYYR